MVTVLALYANSPGSRFDAVYYRDRHTPFALELLTPYGLTGLRMTEGLADLDGGPPLYWMISEMRFASREAFGRAMDACGSALFADAPNYTGVQPVLQLVADGIELAVPTSVETRTHA